jgi:hypothetical protein
MRVDKFRNETVIVEYHGGGNVTVSYSGARSS